jgi:DNA-binding MarR family transcriptional regulator
MSQDFDRDLLLILHDVARLMRVEADRLARIHGMTRAQWGILLRLARSPGSSQKELADLLEVEPISVARLVDRLEASGLVERRADEQDRRIWRLHLLPAATALLETIAKQRRELASFVTAGMPKEVHEIMLDGLACMKANLLRGPLAEPLPAPAAQPHAAAQHSAGARGVAHAGTDVLERAPSPPQEKA